MSKFIIAAFFALTSIEALAQIENKPIGITVTQNTPVPFRLFPTQNAWTFIELNTRTGQMWQVHCDVEKDIRLVITLSSEALVTKEKEANDRFTLYSTRNIYTFILLDQLNGRTWQVQWSINSTKRRIIPIE